MLLQHGNKPDPDQRAALCKSQAREHTGLERRALSALLDNSATGSNFNPTSQWRLSRGCPCGLAEAARKAETRSDY